jgi:hypothetical protein
MPAAVVAGLAARIRREDGAARAAEAVERLATAARNAASAGQRTV